MRMLALSRIALNSPEEARNGLEETLQELRSFKAADVKLNEACMARGIEKPRLVAADTKEQR